MKYICIKECCTLDMQLRVIKTWFRVGQIYDLTGKPDKEYFEKITL